MANTVVNESAARQAAKTVVRWASRLGFDLMSLLSIRYLPKYWSERRKFRALGGAITHSYPILSDFRLQAGSARGHYFHQDLLVARLIFEAAPRRHIDVGSRIDGFVAHVASFRRIEVMDIRGASIFGHENISFLQADLMNELTARSEVADSISCLHAIEHFGLGRYGDSLNPEGYIKGFENLIRMLEPNGKLYVSVPIGKANEVHFNAHRVFKPADILGWSNKATQLELVRFDYVDDNGDLHLNADLSLSEANEKFGCGIYCFRKIGKL